MFADVSGTLQEIYEENVWSLGVSVGFPLLCLLGLSAFAIDQPESGLKLYSAGSLKETKQNNTFKPLAAQPRLSTSQVSEQTSG